MFESIISFFKKLGKNEKESSKSKDAAKERLHLVLMQDRANISADFLALMKQEIIEVIKRYIDVDENAIDVRLTNKSNDDGTTGAPVLYANIPIVSVKEDARKIKNAEDDKKDVNEENIKESNENKEDNNQEVELNESDNLKEEIEEESEETKEKLEEKKEEIEDKELQDVIQKAEEIVEEDKKEQI